MLNSKRALLLAVLAIAGVARTQDMTAEVTRDPRAGLATYDFHFEGPPRGQALLFVSVGLLPLPFNLPPIGNLFLPLNLMVPFSPLLQLDQKGQIHWQIRAPLALTEDHVIAVQPIFLDPRNILRLGVRAIALAHGRAKVPSSRFGYTFAYETGKPSLRVAGQGRPGATVEVRVADSKGTRVSKKTKIDKNGRFFVEGAVPGGVTPNDDVLILVDGKLQAKVDLYKFK